MRKFVLVLLIMILLLWGHSLAKSDTIYFVYAATQYAGRDAVGSYQNPTGAEVRWFPVGNPQAEQHVTIQPFGLYALSPSGDHIAFKGIGREGSLYILDLSDGKLTTLNYQQPTQEFLTDSYAIKSSSMVWSPDDEKLAFTVSVDGNPDSRGDVYIYDTKLGNVRKITENLPILRSLIIPASWSPDGKWLVVYGAWSQTDGPTSLVPVFESGVFSADGQTFLELANKANTCRLVWSPDMHWLASDTACFAGVGNSTSLMLIPFDPEPITSDGQRLDQITSPLVLDWGFSASWSYHYRAPIWKDANTVVAYRELGPISFGLLPDDVMKKYTVQGLVSFDVRDYSQNMLPLEGFGSSTMQLGDWYADKDTFGNPGILAYNPITERTLNIPNSVQSCPISYALQIEAQGNFVAVLDACSSEERRSQAMIQVYETASYRALFSVTADVNTYLLPLEFARTVH